MADGFCVGTGSGRFDGGHRQGRACVAVVAEGRGLQSGYAVAIHGYVGGKAHEYGRLAIGQHLDHGYSLDPVAALVGGPPAVSHRVTGTFIHRIGVYGFDHTGRAVVGGVEVGLGRQCLAAGNRGKDRCRRRKDRRDGILYAHGVQAGILVPAIVHDAVATGYSFWAGPSAYCFGEHRDTRGGNGTGEGDDTARTNVLLYFGEGRRTLNGTGGSRQRAVGTGLGAHREGIRPSTRRSIRGRDGVRAARGRIYSVGSIGIGYDTHCRRPRVSVLGAQRHLPFIAYAHADVGDIKAGSRVYLNAKIGDREITGVAGVFHFYRIARRAYRRRWGKGRAGTNLRPRSVRAGKPAHGIGPRPSHVGAYGRDRIGTIARGCRGNTQGWWRYDSDGDLFCAADRRGTGKIRARPGDIIGHRGQGRIEGQRDGRAAAAGTRQPRIRGWINPAPGNTTSVVGDLGRELRATARLDRDIRNA